MRPFYVIASPPLITTGSKLFRVALHMLTTAR